MDYIQLTFQAFLLIMPVVFAGALHMLAVKKDILHRTKVPINSSLLGANKTYRGIILMPTFTAIGTFLLYLSNEYLPTSIRLSLGFWQSIQLGVLLGIAYVLFELPNSFFKRQLGIPPGKSADKYRLFFRLLDCLDSTIGCLMVFHFFLRVEFISLIILLVLGLTAHPITTNILYMFRIRHERW